MTSTSITKVGGVVVVTQVIPQDEKAIPLQTPANTTTKAPPPVKKATPTPPTKVDDMTSAFLRGEPQGLGVVQIVIGLLCVLFSLTAIFSPALMLHAPLCLAITFVVSGSLALAATGRTSISLVWASLFSNVLSVALGLVGVAYVCWLLAARPASERFCENLTTYDLQFRCASNMWILDMVLYGCLGLLLVLLVLHVCVAVTVCVFSGKAIRRRDRYTPILVEVDDGSTLRTGTASEHDSDVALLDSDGEGTPTSPPNSP